VVPMEHVETYFRHEITSEGRWASGRRLIIVRPAVDAGLADDGWFTRTLERSNRPPHRAQGSGAEPGSPDRGSRPCRGGRSSGQGRSIHPGIPGNARPSPRNPLDREPPRRTSARTLWRARSALHSQLAPVGRVRGRTQDTIAQEVTTRSLPPRRVARGQVRGPGVVRPASGSASERLEMGHP
jgi:hypothetical protein